MHKTPPPDPANWWIEDSQGRFIGYMWPEDMLAVIDSVWGRRKGIGGFMRYSGYNRTTIEKYCNGKKPIPKHIAHMVLLIQREAITRRTQRHTGSPDTYLPTADADWLPDHKPRKPLDTLPAG